MALSPGPLRQDQEAWGGGLVRTFTARLGPPGTALAAPLAPLALRLKPGIWRQEHPGQAGLFLWHLGLRGTRAAPVPLMAPQVTWA